MARVEQISVTELPLTGEPGFRIVDSSRTSEAAALISPDAATCRQCLREQQTPGDRRHRYPFINCTGLRAALHHRRVGPLRPPADDHAPVHPLPGVRPRVRRRGRPALPCRAQRLPGVRTAPDAARPDRRGPGRAGGGAHAGPRPARAGENRGGQGAGRLPPRLRRDPATRRSRACAGARAGRTGRSRSCARTWRPPAPTPGSRTPRARSSDGRRAPSCWCAGAPSPCLDTPRSRAPWPRDTSTSA